MTEAIGAMFLISFGCFSIIFGGGLAVMILIKIGQKWGISK